MLRVWLIAALLAVGIGGPALAQQPTQAQANAIRQSCRADYQAHCSSVPSGGSASLACLQENAASLSRPCQQALAAVSGGASSAGTAATAPKQGTAPRPQMSPRDELALTRRACGEDYRLQCSGIRPGGGRAIACLEDHQESLSRQCRAALQSARQGG